MDSPDMLNAGPERLTAVIVSTTFPALVSVTLSVAFPPTDTLPNVRGEGETDNAG